MKKNLVIDRKVSMRPDLIHFYIGSHLLHIKTNELNVRGGEISPATEQFFCVDDYAKDLMQKLTEWALSQLR